MIFYFSGCGNSKHMAETIAAGLNDTLTFIPEAARGSRYEYELAEGESLGFVFPVYSWAPPKLVTEFINKLQMQQPSYLYFACTCGDECGRTEKIFRKTVVQKGWQLNACFSLVMPETYIAMPGFKLDSEEKAHKKITTADAAMRDFIPRLANKEVFSAMKKGGAAWLKSYVINPGFNRFATDDKKYRSTEACIHCGKCMEICPLRNITLEEGRPVWHGHCTICMACYHHCPVNAIQYGKATEGKGQYWFGMKNG